MDNLTFLDAGFQTTVQDSGRLNYQIEGFPQSGYMDFLSAETSNILLGNERNTAVFEFAFSGPTIKFNCPTFFTITGAEYQPKLNGQQINTYQVYQANINDVLTIGACHQGRFGYLAILGGISVPKLMNSYSTTTRIGIGGFHGRKLESGDNVMIHSSETLVGYYHRKTASTLNTDAEKTIRFVKGPQWNMFSDTDRRALLSTTFTLTNQSDRMGYRLSGKKIGSNLSSLLSEGTVRGEIQIPNDGQPIVLMVDRQTTGGYPVIAAVSSADIPLLVQSQPGTKLRFKEISLSESTELIKKQSQQLNKLQNQITQSLFKPPYGINRIASHRISELFEEV
ncbi:hypothetical protein PL11_002835 [Lentilactobacillus curieae]|uniref:Carboxyltransferase domain-containing protein n=1 Tax=Lentilactobacillus curieae TaxID=1138822 RepID=A0A1S6QH29_9LACO|nr:biotin-dependent carboxyltransferase family protein [Lentilactobacillus curieae]AQW20926.1 hypothetical protein PL11_002835 [Lentilactobacillus curieae]